MTYPQIAAAFDHMERVPLKRVQTLELETP
jgi:hypothetical protein